MPLICSLGWLVITPHSQPKCLPVCLLERLSHINTAANGRNYDPASNTTSTSVSPLRPTTDVWCRLAAVQRSAWQNVIFVCTCIYNRPDIWLRSSPSLSATWTRKTSNWTMINVHLAAACILHQTWFKRLLIATRSDALCSHDRRNQFNNPKNHSLITANRLSLCYSDSVCLSVCHGHNVHMFSLSSSSTVLVLESKSTTNLKCAFSYCSVETPYKIKAEFEILGNIARHYNIAQFNNF